MRDALLITDSACDLPRSTLDAVGVELLFFPYALDGEEQFDDADQDRSLDTFYDALRGGARSTTAQLRPADCEAAFRHAHDLGMAAILVPISSGLSASYGTALTVREEFVRENPGARIYVVDSLSVSANQGLLVIEMARQLDDGASAEEVVEWAEANRLRANACFTVDSFEYLVRGGRVSPAVGAVGSALNVKPLLHVDAKGGLTALKRVRGRRHALMALADLVADQIADPGGQTIIVNHAQCLDDAESLVRSLTERLAVQDVRLGRVGVIIGTHMGPGGLVVGFWGKPRPS